MTVKDNIFAWHKQATILPNCSVHHAHPSMKINDVPLSDLIHPQMVKGFDGDLKWHFTKLAGVKGIFDTNIEAFDPNTTLV